MKHNSSISVRELNGNLEFDTINQVWYAIMKMDSELLNLLLDSDIDYEDIGKARFISKLIRKFDTFRSLGDSELMLDLECCKGCNCDKPICKFIGNVSGKHFGLFFEYKNDVISDIYHCYWYESSNLLDLL